MHRLAACRQGYYGGVVAAPIFKRIAEATLRYLGVGPTINPEPPVLVERRDTTRRSDETAERRANRSSASSLTSPPARSRICTGMSAREAVRKLVKLGLTAHVSGDGFVMSQDPAAGAPLEPGAVCRLVLNRWVARSRAGRPAMTWAQLHDVLRASGVIRADAAPTWDPASAGSADANRTITGVAYDSRTVEPGAVFVALERAPRRRRRVRRGRRSSGARRRSSQSSRLRPGGLRRASAPPANVRAPWIVVQDARLALALLAAAFFRHPSAEMQVVGITGTNGKTTTAYLLSSIFEAAGIRCGVLGTVAYRIGDELREATRTTPEAPDVQRLLREMVDRGCGACAMEVSSHALALRRVDGMTFRGRSLHEPDARSPRFSRGHGAVLSGQAAAVRDAAARQAEPAERRRSARRLARARSWAGR